MTARHVTDPAQDQPMTPSPAETNLATYDDTRLAALYDHDNPPGEDPAFFRQVADEASATRIVDLGCGTGSLTVTLAGEGRTVVGIDPVEYRHTMETLALVEGFSTAQCAPHVTAEEIEAAREVNEAMRALAESEEAWDPVAFTELNRHFHSILFEHHQNEHVHDLVHRGWNRLAALRSSTFAYVPGRADASVDEHEHLLRLIEDGARFEEIEAAARAHRLNTLHAYLEHTAEQSA